MKKKLILVAAPPACGKTYVSQRIAEAIPQIVYLDKDDLCDLLRAAFRASGEPVDMDGAFYIDNLRSSEYATILHIAFSTLRYADHVLLNAPLGKEVRDAQYMRTLKIRANEMGADLLLIWVTAPTEVCYQRMKSRNSDRDLLKLANWEAYVSKINYTPPVELAQNHAVDELLVFDSTNDTTTAQSLEKALKMIIGE